MTLTGPCRKGINKYRILILEIQLRTPLGLPPVNLEVTDGLFATVKILQTSKCSLYLFLKLLTL